MVKAIDRLEHTYSRLETRPLALADVCVARDRYLATWLEEDR